MLSNIFLYISLWFSLTVEQKIHFNKSLNVCTLSVNVSPLSVKWCSSIFSSNTLLLFGMLSTHSQNRSSSKIKKNGHHLIRLVLVAIATNLVPLLDLLLSLSRPISCLCLDCHWASQPCVTCDTLVCLRVTVVALLWCSTPVVSRHPVPQ